MGLSNKLCECGCGKRTKIAVSTNVRYGNVMGQPNRFVHGHHRRYVEPYEVNENGCWIWTGSSARGYGRTWINKKCIKAHRLMWERYRGPIPPGLVIDHLCMVPACVNPDHLEPVTQAENMRRFAAFRKTRQAALNKSY